MKLVKITWGPLECECDQCICQTQISFREQGSTSWYTPSSPDNPTQNNNYQILIEEGIYYQVRLTFIGPRCQEKSTYFSLYYPEAGCCPEGYTASPDTTYCYKVEDVDAIPPSGAVDTLDHYTLVTYSVRGSYIYNTGYNINGTGTSTQIPLSNNFWKNGPGDGSDGNLTDGPLNRTAVWVTPIQSDQDIGFGVCIDVPESKIYYVGIGTDNYGIITVDNTVIVQQDAAALALQYFGDIAAPFKVWHIYPVFLEAGPHILEIRGHNVAPPAAIGCEVYNATADDLIDATSYAALGPKLIFSSKDYFGQEAQLGTGDSGYTCPEGYSLAPCEDPIKCRRILRTDPIDC